MDDESKREDIYEEEGMQEAIDADEIDEVEQGFMQGYYDDDRASKCALCEKVLKDPEHVIELEIEDETFRFCSEECAEKFQKKYKKE